MVRGPLKGRDKRERRAIARSGTKLDESREPRVEISESVTRYLPLLRLSPFISSASAKFPRHGRFSCRCRHHRYRDSYSGVSNLGSINLDARIIERFFVTEHYEEILVSPSRYGKVEKRRPFWGAEAAPTREREKAVTCWHAARSRSRARVRARYLPCNYIEKQLTMRRTPGTYVP